MSDLTYDYAYDKDLGDFLAPDDPRVRPRHPYKVGTLTVFLVRAEERCWHFRRSRGSGGTGSNETPAHIFAKKFFKEQMQFYATIQGQPLLIRFESCEVEQRIDMRQPDFTATVSECWPPFLRKGERFLLEIHAHNDVDRDPARRPALEQIGIPCVELHLPEKAVSWKPGGEDRESRRQRFERYMRTVLADPYYVEWVVPKSGVRYALSAESLQMFTGFPRT
jgi:hypothetical protein